jgi:hypothetical protein
MIMSGKLQTKSISKVLVSKTTLFAVLEFLIAFGLGALAITLHARLRMPMRIPGHHGLEFMALLFIGRSLIKSKFSGTFFSFGTGTMLFIPFLGFSDPFAPIVYMLPGILIDVFNFVKPKYFKNIYITAIIGGLAYAAIPFTRILISFITGYYYKSLAIHPIYTIVSYIGFGLAGTIITLGIIKSFKK